MSCKLCPNCNETKALSEYYILKKTQKPLPYCKPCSYQKKKEHRERNPTGRRGERRRWYDRVKNDPHFKTAKNIRKRLKKLLKNKSMGAFSSMVGCSKEELVKHLESQFTEGMSWDNYGIEGWHIDHIRPLASFDVTDSSTWKEANHYSNLRPSWKQDNHDKGSEWNGVKWEKGKPVGDR